MSEFCFHGPKTLQQPYEACLTFCVRTQFYKHLPVTWFSNFGLNVKTKKKKIQIRFHMGKSAQRIQKLHAYDQQLDANFQDSTFLITCCPDMAT